MFLPVLADEERGESAPRAHLPEQSTPTKTPKSQSAQLARLSKTTARQFKMATYNTLPSADVEADKPLLAPTPSPGGQTCGNVCFKDSDCLTSGGFGCTRCSSYDTGAHGTCY